MSKKVDIQELHFKGDSKNLENATESSRKKLERLNKEIEKGQGELIDLNYDLKKSEAELNKWEKTLDKNTKSVSDLTKKLNKQEEKQQRLEKSTREARNEYTKSITEQNKLSKEISNTEKRIKKQEIAFSELSKTNYTSNARMKSMADTQRATKAQLEFLNAELRNQQNYTQMAGQKYQVYNNILQNTNAGVQRFSTLTQQANAELKLNSAKAAQSENAVTKLTNAIKRENNILDANIQSLRELDPRYSKLANTVADSATKINRSAKQLDMLDNSVDDNIMSLRKLTQEFKNVEVKGQKPFVASSQKLDATLDKVADSYNQVKVKMQPYLKETIEITEKTKKEAYAVGDAVYKFKVFKDELKKTIPIIKKTKQTTDTFTKTIKKETVETKKATAQTKKANVESKKAVNFKKGFVSAFKKSEKAIDEETRSINKNSEALKKNDRNVNDLKQDMKQLSKQNNKVTRDFNFNSKNLRFNTDALEANAKSSQRVGAAFNSAFAKVAAVNIATTAVVGMTVKMLELDRVITNVNNTFDNAFKNANEGLDTMNKKAENFAYALGEWPSQVKKTSAQIKNQAQLYGLASDEATKYAEISTGLIGILSKTNQRGLDWVQTSERVVNALRGEAESAELLNLSLSQTAMKDYTENTLKAAGATNKSFKEMNAAEQQAVRLSAALYQTAIMQGIEIDTVVDAASAQKALLKIGDQVYDQMSARQILLINLQTQIHKFESTLIKAAKIIATVFAGLALPILFIINLLSEFKKVWIDSFTKTIDDSIKPTTSFKDVLLTVLDVFEKITGAVQYLAKTMGYLTATAVNTLMPVLERVGSAMYTYIINPVLKAASVMKDKFDKFAPLVKNTFDSVISTIQGAFSTIGGMFDKLKPVIDYIWKLQEMWADVYDAIVTYITPIVDYIKNNLDVIIARIEFFISQVWERFVYDLKRILDAVVPILQGIFDAFMNILTPLVGAIKDVFVQLVPFIIKTLGGVLKFIYNFGKVVIPIIQTVLGVVLKTVGYIIKALAPVVKGVYDVLSGLVSGVIEIIEWAAGKLTDIFSSIDMPDLSGFKNAIVSVFGFIATAAITFYNGIIVPLTPILKTFFSFIGNALSKIATLIAPLVELAKVVLEVVWQGILLIVDAFKLLWQVVLLLLPVIQVFWSIIIGAINIVINIIGILWSILAPILDFLIGVLVVILDIIINIITIFMKGVKWIIIGLRKIIGVIIKLLKLLTPLFKIISLIIAVAINGIMFVANQIAKFFAWLSDKIMKIFTFITDVITWIIDGITNLITAAMDIIMPIVSWINDVILLPIKGFFDALVTGITDGITSIKTWFIDTWNSIYDFFVGIVNKLIDLANKVPFVDIDNVEYKDEAKNVQAEAKKRQDQLDAQRAIIDSEIRGTVAVSHSLSELAKLSNVNNYNNNPNNSTTNINVVGTRKTLAQINREARMI